MRTSWFLPPTEVGALPPSPKAGGTLAKLRQSGVHLFWSLQVLFGFGLVAGSAGSRSPSACARPLPSEADRLEAYLPASASLAGKPLGPPSGRVGLQFQFSINLSLSFTGAAKCSQMQPATSLRPAIMSLFRPKQISFEVFLR